MLQALLYIFVFLVEFLIFAKVRSRTARQMALLAGSYVLYFTWEPWFAAVLVASTVMNYLLGEWLRRTAAAWVLSIGVLLNLALLATFKYLPELAGNEPASSLHAFSKLALPLGISFWTFQALSYLFDLYRGEDLDPSFFEFALFMVFFPVTISGPVCRLTEMLPQFRSEEPLAWRNVERGFRRIATGVLMMQLAKLLGHGILAGDGIDSGFDRLTHWSGPDAWCLAFGYGLQLFFNFAGYSHIAIGAAQVLGFTVPENFARPFGSSSVSVFWTRWHMSLSFWIRDYVFLPLAMLRREMWWRNAVLVISMVLFGMWHKASWLFLLWGLYHGVLLVLLRQLQQLERKWNWNSAAPLWTLCSWAATIALVSMGWIFFRAGSLAQARQMLIAVISPGTYSSHFLSSSLFLLVLVLSAGYGVVLAIADAFDRHAASPPSQSEATSSALAFLARKRTLWLPAVYSLTLLTVVVVNYTQGAGVAQFMYRTF